MALAKISLYCIFNKNLLSVKKKENLLFRIYDSPSVKVLRRLRLQFSHLNEHKFRNGFSDTIEPVHAKSLNVFSCTVIFTILKD